MCPWLCSGIRACILFRSGPPTSTRGRKVRLPLEPQSTPLSDELIHQRTSLTTRIDSTTAVTQKMAESTSDIIMDQMSLAPECEGAKAAELQHLIRKLPRAAKAERLTAKAKYEKLNAELESTKLKLANAQSGRQLPVTPASETRTKTREERVGRRESIHVLSTLTILIRY